LHFLALVHFFSTTLRTKHSTRKELYSSICIGLLVLVLVRSGTERGQANIQKNYGDQHVQDVECPELEIVVGSKKVVLPEDGDEEGQHEYCLHETGRVYPPATQEP